MGLAVPWESDYPKPMSVINRWQELYDNRSRWTRKWWTIKYSRSILLCWNISATIQLNVSYGWNITTIIKCGSTSWTFFIVCHFLVQFSKSSVTALLQFFANSAVVFSCHLLNKSKRSLRFIAKTYGTFPTQQGYCTCKLLSNGTALNAFLPLNTA